MEAKELREMSVDDLVQKRAELTRGDRPLEAETGHEPIGKSR